MIPATVAAPAELSEPVGFVPLAESGGRQEGRFTPRVLWHPLTAICLVQAALSLTLVWSNTAFTDEAANLWVGRLELRHWLHGTSWPASYGHDILPGSPLVYPPIGAIASSLGGIAGARVLSLALMLGATVLLYFVTERLAGSTAAVIACTLWALTEPVLRLAFATADPLAIFFFAVAAWLVLQAGQGRRHGELVAAAGAVLALANATSYQAIVIDPVFIGFAFLAWRPRFGTPQAAESAAWLTAAWAVFLGVALTVSTSWAGFAASIGGSGTASRQGVVPLLTDVWSYSGLVIVLGLVGVVVGRSVRGATAGGPAAGGQAIAGLAGLLGWAALFALIVEMLSQSTASIDSKLVYGLWFTAIAAGYGCSVVLRWLPGANKPLAVSVCAIAAGYLALSAWQTASGVYRGWPNSTAFIASFSPLAARTKGLLFVAGQEHVAQYYTPQGDDWARWDSDGLSLDPPVKPTASYYRKLLDKGDYGLVTLFYSTSFTTANLPVNALTGGGAHRTANQVLASVGLGANEPGLSALTTALREDRAYRLASSGPYDNGNDHGVYVIWRKMAAR
jgi:Dolichyl-phosphate-mannose-protein mannosyltransferase